MKCSEVIRNIKNGADWDNPGLLAGRSGIGKIHIALDVPDQVGDVSSRQEQICF